MHNQSSSSSRLRAQSGNVLFIILVTVVLFAALSYSVTRSSRVMSGMSQEEVVFSTNAIFRFGEDLRSGVETVLSSNVEMSNVSFVQSDTGAAAVFHVSGGGVKYYTPEEKWLDTSQSGQPASVYQEWFFPADVCVPAVGTGGSGTGTDCNVDGTGGSEELMVILPYVQKDVCIFINRRLGIGLCNGGTDVCAVSGSLWSSGEVAYSGTFADGSMIDDGSGTYNGHHEGCIQGASATATQPTGAYFYYKVLASR